MEILVDLKSDGYSTTSMATNLSWKKAMPLHPIKNLVIITNNNGWCTHCTQLQLLVNVLHKILNISYGVALKYKMQKVVFSSLNHLHCYQNPFCTLFTQAQVLTLPMVTFQQGILSVLQLIESSDFPRFLGIIVEDLLKFQEEKLFSVLEQKSHQLVQVLMLLFKEEIHVDVAIALQVTLDSFSKNILVMSFLFI